MSVANQRIVQIHKSNRETQPFVSLNLQTMGAVYKVLGAHAFFLYLILCGNANGYRTEFSPQNINKNFGMPVSTAQDQFKKLVEKKFLVQRAEGSNVYDFYAEPDFIKASKTLTQTTANVATVEETKEENQNETNAVAATSIPYSFNF